MLVQEESDPAAEVSSDTAAADDFAVVARREAPRLLAVAHSILGDAAAAEDAVQDSLLLAWRSWSSLRDAERRQAWLVRICVRRCVRLRLSLRARAHRETEALPDLPGHAAVDSQATGSADWDAAFRRLSPAQRAVVTLHYHHGYTLDECGAALGRRPGTARRHLARALDKLRQEVLA